MSIDAHAHLWTRSRTPQPWIDPAQMPALAKDFALAELVAMQAAAGVSSSVLVQTANSEQETRDFLALAADPAVAGVVGWVDFSAPLAPQLEKYDGAIASGALVGVRHLVHQDPDPQWMSRPSVAAGLKELAAAGLTFDLVLRPDQLAAAAGLVRSNPDTRFVLDHLGKPPLASGDVAAWRADLAEMAAQPNVAAKLSGLTTEADWEAWTTAELGDAVDHALEVFGPERLMFGTDWPVALLAGTDATWPRVLAVLLEGLGTDAQQAIFGGNARRVYKLDPGPCAALAIEGIEEQP